MIISENNDAAKGEGTSDEKLHYTDMPTPQDDNKLEVDNDANDDDDSDNCSTVYFGNDDSYYLFDDDATVTYDDDVDTEPDDTPLYQNQEGDLHVQNMMWNDQMDK